VRWHKPVPSRPFGRAVFPSIDAVVAGARPADPLVCLRPAVIAGAARIFVDSFHGDVLYAVKCNPEPRVLRALWAGGIRHFDCASLPEVKLVRKLLPAADVHFMHPVKSRPAIRDAFHSHDVTDFSFDCADELAKILQETVPVGLVGDPPTLGLFVRLALPKGGAVYDLSGKFGAPPDEAARLLRAARPHAARLGIAFHVGSQCLEPEAYARAMALACQTIANCSVPVDIVDVGGGFPVSYPDMTPPPLGDYIASIEAAAVALPSNIRLWAEPGRALVAAGGSVVVQVQLRRGDTLFVNDGVYGSLSDFGCRPTCAKEIGSNSVSSAPTARAYAPPSTASAGPTWSRSQTRQCWRPRATKRGRRGPQASSQILSVSGRPRMSSRPSGRSGAMPACSSSEAV
jgi:ornithine decarboxylase